MGEIIGNDNQIIINIEDLVPPSNLATIDKDGNVGNAYSKDQFNEKFQDKSADLDDKIAEIKAQVETDFQGTLKPSSSTPTVDGSYKPEIVSNDANPSNPSDYGTLYANAGNLRAKEGYDTMFFKKGAVWTKSEVKIPGSTAKTTYDKTDNVSPATMKAAADRFDPGITVLDSFVNVTKRVETVITMPYAGEVDGKFKNASFGDVAASYAATGQIPIADLQGVDYLKIEGDMTSMGAGAMYLGLRTAGGVNVSLKSGSSTSPFEIEVDHSAQYYVYSRYKYGSNPTKFKKVSIVPDIKPNAVAEAILPQKTVLKSFLNPTEIIWEEISMPYAGENDSKYYSAGWALQDGGSSLAAGSIPNSEFGSEWTLFRVTGDFSLLGAGGGWIGKYKSSSVTSLVTGNQGSYKEYTFAVDSSYLGFVYSRGKGSHKFYKGKVVSVPIKEDAVRDFIIAMGGSAKHRMIDAFSDFGVKAENTAAENTSRLNAAIVSAYLTRVPIYLPAGVIKHNGITYMPGVSMIGAGVENTTLESAAGTNAIALLDGTNTQALWEGNEIKNMTIDGANIADVGLNIRHAFGIMCTNVRLRRFKQYCAIYEGVLAFRFYGHCKMQESVNGIKIFPSTNSVIGYMQCNLGEFNSTWFAEISGKSAEINDSSNITFRSCDFERVGTAGNLNTGGAFATNMSPGNEGIDIVMESCWSETLKGPLLVLTNCKGKSTIFNGMGGNAGNTSTTQVINNGSELLIAGGTQIRFSATGVLTQNNGKTFVDGFAKVNTHTEQTGGTYKTTQYI